jgi:proteasome lid subunit RPN8/RPN11
MSRRENRAVATRAAAPDPLSPRDSHRYALELSTADGRRLGQAAVEPDFQPAREWAYLEGVRRGLLPLVTAPATGAVAPLWCDELGPPYCRGIRVLASDPDGRAQATSEIPARYFAGLAREQAERHVARGDLAHGAAYRYRVCAYPTGSDRPRVGDEPDAADGLRAQPLAEPIAVCESALGAFRDRSEPEDDLDEADACAPVFVAREILDETCSLAGRAGDVETGGVLVGRLHRDSSHPEVFAEITAQIPARHAEAGAASFAFTPETWAAAHAAIELRGDGELVLGWWHSHPCFCRECPEERRRACLFRRPHFSAEDAHLHRACFPQAWQLALLVSDLPDAGPTPALFGWRRGVVARRGYRALRRERARHPKRSTKEES